jgi:Zn-dependent M28 family amino/carboxypeptidase
MRLLWAGVAALSLSLAACSPERETADAPASETPGLTTSPEIAAADIRARVKELSDDKYEGRGPGTPSGEASAQWIADEYKRIGLEPAVDGSYFQTVEMVAQTVQNDSSKLSVSANGKAIDFQLGPDAVIGTKRQDQTTVSFENSDMVFVGYGVVAPEANWNDYAGIDARGKTVVMFVNDPGFITNDDTLFNGQAMTYYGRWTYKFEEAGRQGATGVLLIHETEPASYGWNVVEGSWTGEQADLVRADAGASRAVLEGWITLEKAKELFAAANLDIDALRAAANKRGFKPVPMTGLKASASITQTIERRQSRNVAGTIRGASAPDEHIVLMAHWDHLGRNAAAAAGEDAIYNGAIDNATGVAGIIEIAEKLAADPKPARSVTLVAVTLEESGLLGSAYFAENPFIPLNKIVAGLNLDALQPAGPAKDVVVIGAGASQLETLLGEELARTGRVIRPDPEPEAGYFYRSDHISLAKKGVPMLYVDSGVDLVDGGEAAGRALGEAYRAKDYHAPSDDFREDWDFSGMEADMKVAHALVARIANSSDWPNWNEGNEFRALRDEMLAGR